MLARKIHLELRLRICLLTGVSRSCVRQRRCGGSGVGGSDIERKRLQASSCDGLKRMYASSCGARLRRRVLRWCVCQLTGVPTLVCATKAA